MIVNKKGGAPQNLPVVVVDDEIEKDHPPEK
jgi:hypothetical protein